MSSRILLNPISRSVALHVFLLLLAFIYMLTAPKISKPAEPITVDFLDKVQKAADIKKDDSQSKKMIVQKSDGQEAKVAKKDSYLSDKTRMVENERSATRSGEAVPLGIPSVKPTVSKSPPQAKSDAHPAPKAVKLSDLGMKLSPKDTATYEKERNWANQATGETIRGGQYIQGMKEGDTSALNTKEFVFYSYFERVRRQLDQAWQPILREQIQRIYKNGRKLASNMDYTTRTMVTLSAKGEIVRVQLLEQSGTTDLDQAAVDALNKAGPYPNPPKGLINDSNQVQIRWDFILKT